MNNIIVEFEERLALTEQALEEMIRNKQKTLIRLVSETEINFLDVLPFKRAVEKYKLDGGSSNNLGERCFDLYSHYENLIKKENEIKVFTELLDRKYAISQFASFADHRLYLQEYYGLDSFPHKHYCSVEECIMFAHDIFLYLKKLGLSKYSPREFGQGGASDTSPKLNFKLNQNQVLNLFHELTKAGNYCSNTPEETIDFIISNILINGNPIKSSKTTLLKEFYRFKNTILPRGKRIKVSVV